MAIPRTIIYPRRGEIYLVSFDPTLGAEIKKTRPALILQNDVANRASPITIVAAITSQFEETLYPTEVFLSAREASLPTDSVILLNQIRSVDKRRLVRRLGTVSRETMKNVDHGLALSMGLVSL